MYRLNWSCLRFWVSRRCAVGSRVHGKEDGFWCVAGGFKIRATQMNVVVSMISDCRLCNLFAAFKTVNTVTLN